MRFTKSTVGKTADPCYIVSVFENAAEQRGNTVPYRFFSPFFIEFQKTGKTHVFLGGENLLAEQYFPKTVFFLLFIIVQGSKVFFVESCKERTENGGQREILKRIIQNLEERP